MNLVEAGGRQLRTRIGEEFGMRAEGFLCLSHSDHRWWDIGSGG